MNTIVLKEIRKKTGAGVMEIKRALDEAGGDAKKAEAIIKNRGVEIAAKKSERVTSQGLIDSYIHLGKIGVLVELNCETDFVARNEDFKKIAHEVALQVVSSDAEDVATFLQESYFKDESKTIQDLLTDVIAKTGENIKIKRFVKFILGEK